MKTFKEFLSEAEYTYPRKLSDVKPSDGTKFSRQNFSMLDDPKERNVHYDFTRSLDRAWSKNLSPEMAKNAIKSHNQIHGTNFKDLKSAVKHGKDLEDWDVVCKRTLLRSRGKKSVAMQGIHDMMGERPESKTDHPAEIFKNNLGPI